MHNRSIQWADNSMPPVCNDAPDPPGYIGIILENAYAQRLDDICVASKRATAERHTANEKTKKLT